VPINSKILKKLEEWKEKEEVDPKFIEFYQKLLHIQSRAEQRIGIPQFGLSSEAISERIEHGLPLIAFDEIALDWSLLQDVFAEVTEAFTTYSELFNDFPQNLKEPEPCLPLSKETAKEWFEGARLLSLIEVNEVSEHLLEAIIHATLNPFLVSYSNALLGLVNQERWRRGYCPICGGNPDFAFLDKERGARWLLCSRCDAEWLFQRLECPYCGTQDQDALAYFTDDEGLYRLYVCERCKRYLKALDLRQAKSDVLLPLERLFTFDIDAQAKEYGYSPCDRTYTRVER
jgi:FdhE protein